MQALQSLWDAAVRGDCTTVRRLLRQYKVPVDTVHHVYEKHLVLDVAEVETSSKDVDRMLRDVLQLLEQAGWDLTVKDKTTKQNALHALVKQMGGFEIQERLSFLVHTQMQRPKLNNMLAALDWGGKLPEQRVSWTRDGQVKSMLRANRAKIEQLVDAMEASAMAQAFAAARAAKADEAAAAGGGRDRRAVAAGAPRRAAAGEGVMTVFSYWGPPIVEEPEDDE